MVDYNFEDAIRNIFSSIPSSIEKSNEEETVLK